MVDPGKNCEIRGALENEVRESPSRQICRGNSISDVATSRSESRSGVETNRTRPVARSCKGSTPVVRDVRAESLGKKVMEGIDEMTCDACIGVEFGSDARAEMVRSTPSAECDSTVCSALSVDEDATAVRERWSIIEADLRPHIVIQRLRRDHQGVQRHNRALLSGQRRCERLGRPDDSRSAKISAIRHDSSRLDSERRHSLQNSAAERANDFGETARESTRIQNC